MNKKYKLWNSITKKFVRQEFWAQTFMTHDSSKLMLLPSIGLKDCDGTDILEGDILENQKSKVKYKVIYNSKAAAYQSQMLDSGKEGFGVVPLPSLAKSCKVVGNVLDEL